MAMRRTLSALLWDSLLPWFGTTLSADPGLRFLGFWRVPNPPAGVESMVAHNNNLRRLPSRVVPCRPPDGVVDIYEEQQTGPGDGHGEEVVAAVARVRALHFSSLEFRLLASSGRRRRGQPGHVVCLLLLGWLAANSR